MRILKITALSFIAIGSLILTPTTANSAPKKSSNKQITISVEIEGGKELVIKGTQKQVDAKILKLQKEAIASVQKAIAGNSCRVTLCTKTDIDDKTGNSIKRPLTDTEVAIQESKALINAINFFGYNHLQLYEYYRNIDQSSSLFSKLHKVLIPDIFDNSVEGWNEMDFIAGKYQNQNTWKKTNLFNLLIRVNSNHF